MRKRKENEVNWMERKVIGRGWRYLLCPLAVLLVWTIFFARVAQAESYEKDKKGSLTLTFQQKEEGTGTGQYQGIEGIEMNLYQIGSLCYEEGQVSFRLDSPYDSVGLDLSAKNSASKMEEAAGKMAQIAKKSSVDPLTQASDAQGVIRYTDLAQGVYLLVQGQESSQIQVSPLILTLPYQQEGEWIYQVESYPKFTTKSQPTATPTTPSRTNPTVTPSSSQKGSVVNTGDDTGVLPWLASLCLAGALASLLWKTRGRKRLW